jgi:phytoene dehydrogenase-like protein
MTHPAVEASPDVAASPWDVVVVGGGIGGLAAASLLARAGRRVMLLERSAALGGACLGVTADGFRYDLGVGIVTGTGPGGAVAALCARLGIRLPTVGCDPTVQVATPRHRVSLPRTVDGWWPEIHREFAVDEEGWHAFLLRLSALAADREQLAQAMPPFRPDGWRGRFRCWRTLAARRLSSRTRQATRGILRAADQPLRAALDECGLGEASRRALEACLWFMLLRGTDECSTLEAALAIQRYREGVAVVAPGPVAMVDALARCLRESGGAVRLQTEAVRCLEERGRIVGVETSAGEAIRGRWTVTDVPPGNLTTALMPPSRHRWRRAPTGGVAWRPRLVAQVMGLALPAALLPTELGHLCLVVPDPRRPARDDNLVFVRTMADAGGPGADGSLIRMVVGRFVPPSSPAEEPAILDALLGALDQIVPGVAAAVVHRSLLPSAALGALWGRPMAAVRYESEPDEWLGRRGVAHQMGRPGLLAVGEWTYPGRLVSDVMEGAMHVADLIAGSEGRDAAR